MVEEIPDQITEEVTRIVNRLLAGLNTIDAKHRPYATIAVIGHIAEQVFTYFDRPEMSFLLITNMVKDAYDEAMSSQGKNIQ